MRGIILTGLICASAVFGGCGNNGGSAGGSDAKPKPPSAELQVPEDVRAAGEAALGNEAEVLAWGDLALNGKQQVMVINRLRKPNVTLPGIVFSRFTVLESDSGSWKQVLLCDEHLKNSNGFLGGAPAAAVSAWRLQYEKNAEKGLLLFFIPFEQGPSIRTQAIEVRWNPTVKRYQALDLAYENFVGEAPALEEVHRKIK